MTTSNKQKLTKSNINKIQTPEKETTYWDTELKGFGLRVYPSSKKSFILKYRNAQNRSKQLKIGHYGVLTPDQARKEAISYLAQIQTGKDPIQERNQDKNSLRIQGLCTQYVDFMDKGLLITKRGTVKKESTIKTDKSRISNYIIPLLGQTEVSTLSSRDVSQMMNKIITQKTKRRGGPGTASKTVKLLSAILNWAISQNLATHNPAAMIQKPQDKRRDRFYTPAEFRLIGLALIQLKQDKYTPQAIIAVLLLALTGCRKSEILKLKFSEVNHDKNYLNLTDSKTGKNIRPLSPITCKILQKLPHLHPTYVFASPKKEEHLKDLKRIVAKIRTISGVKDFKLHTLRHSFATTAAELGYAESTISAMLGHSNHSITSRYIHTLDQTIIQATSQTSMKIIEKLNLSEENIQHLIKL